MLAHGSGRLGSSAEQLSRRTSSSSAASEPCSPTEGALAAAASAGSTGDRNRSGRRDADEGSATGPPSDPRTCAGSAGIPVPRRFREAADGIRTHDLLHGKQNVRSRASQESPGKEQFPSYRWSAMLSSFYREITGVSGLKPDWGPCPIGRRLRSHGGLTSRPRSPLAVGQRSRCDPAAD